jgi:glutamate synthase (NADPH/NADH) large chain
VDGGRYWWRRRGERHVWNPATISAVQQAVRGDDAVAWRRFTDLVEAPGDGYTRLRDLLEFAPARPVRLDEVEPWTEIVTRFCTGAMSFGSISAQAHETLAIAMNRIGGRSNSGEGGEESRRFKVGE